VASHKLLLLETSLKSIISYVMGTHRLGGYTNLTDNRLLTTEDDPFSQWILHHSRHIYIFEYLLHDCLSSSCVFSLWWLFVYVILHRSSFISTYRRTKLLTCHHHHHHLDLWHLVVVRDSSFVYPLMILSKEKRKGTGERKQLEVHINHQPRSNEDYHSTTNKNKE